MSDRRMRSKRKQDLVPRDADPDPKVLKSTAQGSRLPEPGTSKKTNMTVSKKIPRMVAGQQTMKMFLASKSSAASDSSSAASSLVTDPVMEEMSMEPEVVEDIVEAMAPLVDTDAEAQVEQSVMPQVTRDPTFKVPVYLQQYFKYEGHVANSSNIKKPIVMTCKRCVSDPNKQSCKTWYVGAPYSNFKDHLWREHSDDYAAEAEKGNIQASNPRRLPSSTDYPISKILNADRWTAPTNKDTYPKKHPIQKRFEVDVLDCISIDMMPMEILQKPCVAKMIRNIDPKLRLFSRRTIGRRLSDFYENKFKPRNIALAGRVNEGCFHLILDLWTDRQKTSILGIKGQFITTDWKLHNTVLAFRHFAGHHFADAIRKIFDAVFLEMLKLKPNHIGFVVGDSASNMRAAFKPGDTTSDATVFQIEFEEEEAPEDHWVDMDNFFDEPEENEEYEVMDVSDVGPGISLDVSDWQSKDLEKLPCFSHLDQLIIKDAVKKSPVVCNIVNDIKAVKSYLHHSPPAFDSLKAYAKKGLVNQADTRWNTLYGVLERFTEDCMQEALNRVLEESRTTKNPCKIIFTSMDYQKMEIIKSLIKPIVDSTNILQGDEVTSSMIIPTVVCAYKSIDLVDVGEDDGLEFFKRNLLGCFEERFSAHAFSNAESSDDTAQITRLKRITRCEIFRDERLITACVLDPRFKTSPFDEPNFELNRWTCTSSKAIGVVESLMAALPAPETETPLVESAPTATSETSTSFFRFLKRAPADVPQLRPQNDISELTRFMTTACEAEASKPLEFWRCNALHYPKLAKLAMKYLGFPASSGSVERLFSISGALQRSRRASLQWKTVEMLLCHRDMRINQLFREEGKSV